MGGRGRNKGKTQDGTEKSFGATTGNFAEGVCSQIINILDVLLLQELGGGGWYFGAPGNGIPRRLKSAESVIPAL